MKPLTTEVTHALSKYNNTFHPVVPFNPSEDRLLKLDFTAANTALADAMVKDTDSFSDYISQLISSSHARYGIGGYNEHRTIYSRSEVFNGSKEEPRRLHLGTDIWGAVNTPVYAPLGGMVHSFAFNEAFGDYGATIILMHQLDGYAFHTLYGHLSLKDIQHLNEGDYISRGVEFAHFGPPEENGNWPPHLHFQIIIDMEYKEGDYPGVCRYSEREYYLSNCPDADLILQMMQYTQ